MAPLPEPAADVELAVTVNGEARSRRVPGRRLLVHFLRDDLGLTGTRIGCETSTCGCCTVLLDGRPVKPCAMLAVQAHGRELTTIEGLDDDGELTPLQASFSANHGLQCGYCTAGMVMTATGLLADGGELTREEIKHGISGNLCRCTGYKQIVDAIEAAAAGGRG